MVIAEQGIVGSVTRRPDFLGTALYFTRPSYSERIMISHISILLFAVSFNGFF